MPDRLISNMSKNRPKIIVISGPTSVGKSSLAVKVAKRFNGEIIAADSRQVYKKLNLGTGKINKKEMRGVTHHLLDVRSAKNRMTVSEYSKLGHKGINKILSENKLPIICGGTGFYIDALIYNKTFPEVGPNERMRQKLEKKQCDELFLILNKLDALYARRIDRKNKRKLIRAIEIATVLGHVPKVEVNKKYDILYIVLHDRPDNLRERIKNRLNKRIRDGMIDEVRQLHDSGISWKRLDELGLEYRFISLFLQKKLTRDEMTQKLFHKIWQFARRQLTWFRKVKEAKWYKADETKAIIDNVKKFISLKKSQ